MCTQLYFLYLATLKEIVLVGKQCRKMKCWFTESGNVTTDGNLLLVPGINCPLPFSLPLDLVLFFVLPGSFSSDESNLTIHMTMTYLCTALTPYNVRRTVLSNPMFEACRNEPGSLCPLLYICLDALVNEKVGEQLGPEQLKDCTWNEVKN